MADRLPSAALLRKLFSYDPITGKLFWKSRKVGVVSDARGTAIFNALYAGKEAFTCISAQGYPSGRLLGKGCTAHRVIWKILHDDEPEQIDHINGDRADNRSANLRAATQHINSRNAAMPFDNTSGRVGVGWDREKKKWIAQIGHRGRNHHLGRYRKFEDAVAARSAAERRFGFHPNHGRKSAAIPQEMEIQP